MIGNNVAHSKLRTKRDFSLNLPRVCVSLKRMVWMLPSRPPRRKDTLALFNP